MHPPSWRTAIAATIKKSRPIKGSNYLTLSTCDSSGARARTVVMRGWHGVKAQKEAERTLLKFVTDGRSRKVGESELLSEICWWFPRTSEQVRAARVV